MRRLIDTNIGGKILHEVRSAAQSRAIAAAGATDRLSPMLFGFQREGPKRFGVAATVQKVLPEGAPPRVLNTQLAGHARSLREQGSQETPTPERPTDRQMANSPFKQLFVKDRRPQV